MIKLNFLKTIYGFLKNPNPESLKMSLADVHGEGIFSLVINGTEPGKLTRVFIADRKLKPFEVQLHSHRYPIRLTAIKGNIRQLVATEDVNLSDSVLSLPTYEYQSPLNGGSGLEYVEELPYVIKDFPVPVGATIRMTENEIHTMTCSKGSIWIVEEGGFEKEKSIVLGVPFITDGLYNAPGQFQINDKVQIVMKAVKQLILDFENIE